MSASITLSKLSWSTPDGRTLFTDLDLAFTTGRAGLVGRNGVGKTTLLKLITGELAPRAGSVTVSGSVGVLRQAVQVGPDETVADLFGVRAALALLRRAEAGEADADSLAEADWTLEERLAASLTRLGLEAGPETRLAALSGGQRTRAALAALTFAQPDFLLLDEPTNNLDREGRDLVIELLAGWRAGAIVVSHDRALLDTMDAIVELTSLGANRFGGNYTAWRARRAIDLAAARHDLADAESRVAEIDRQAQASSERQARRGGTAHRDGRRGGTPRIVLNQRRGDGENTRGANKRLAERRRGQAADQLEQARARIEVLQPFTVSVPQTGLAAGKVVLRLDRVTAGYDAARPVLRDLSLVMAGPERIAVTGPNGSGKSPLLAVAIGGLAPMAGKVQRPVEAALLDQRVALLEPERSIRDNFLRLNPTADENACRAALARFMFRADAALQSVASLSGGQKLRAALACVLGVAPPLLLLLDEPTNHLDLDSIETIEAGLRAYDGALLVVSHDEPFLEAIGVTRRVELRA